MPTIYHAGSWKIAIFADDHAPPHFHVMTPDGDAIVEINTFEVIAGSVKASVMKQALGWASENKDLLSIELERLNERR